MTVVPDKSGPIAKKLEKEKKQLMLKIMTAICMSVVLVESTPIFAAKHEIDQASVKADGGFPYKITKPGSYKLTSNLVVPAGVDGIDILSPDVTLDLNGFSIAGPVVCTGDAPATCPSPTTGIGIKAGDEVTFGPADVKVFNGSVRGMGSHGIFMSGDGSLVEKVSARSNAGDGIIVAGSVVESSAIGNGETGILAVIVRDSEAASNTRDGIDTAPVERGVRSLPRVEKITRSAHEHHARWPALSPWLGNSLALRIWHKRDFGNSAMNRGSLPTRCSVSYAVLK